MRAQLREVLNDIGVIQASLTDDGLFGMVIGLITALGNECHCDMAATTLVDGMVRLFIKETREALERVPGEVALTMATWAVLREKGTHDDYGK